MFTLPNFLKFLLAVSLAGGTTQIPVIGNIPELAGGGVAGNTLGFVILFVFWWFVISQILSFLTFAFGGGVGRYHTTKLSRRLQWLTFAVFTALPVLILGFLLLNATPLSVETEGYRARFEVVQQQRLEAATTARHQAITQAKAQRLRRIQEARAKREAALSQAIKTREAKIEAARRRRLNAIDQAEQKRSAQIAQAQAKREAKIDAARRTRKIQQDKIDHDKRALKHALEARQNKIQAARDRRQVKIDAANQKRQSKFQAALDQYQAQVDDEWGLLEEQKKRILKPEINRRRIFTLRLKDGKNRIKGKTKYKRLIDAISELALKMARARGMTIGIAFNQKLKADIFKYETYQAWRQSDCFELAGEPALICAIIHETAAIGGRQKPRYNSRYVKRFSPHWYDLASLHEAVVKAQSNANKLKAVEAEIAGVEAEYAKEYQKIKAKYRKPRLSDFAEVDESRFPKVNESDFAAVDESEFPLAGRPDLPPVDGSQFPPLDMSRFPPVDVSKFPRVDMKRFPPVDKAAFPAIDAAGFPEIDADDYPLKVESGPISGGFYGDRIEPTFQRHFWWFIPAMVFGWIVFLRQTQTKTAFVYTKVMRFLDEGRFGFGGAARFASMLEEWGKPYKSGALYMGRSLYNPFDDIALGGESHMLTVAGSRGGKGTSAIIPNLLLWEGSCVVIDPKGTNAHVTANARRAMGGDVHIIDPFGIVTDDSARFDPLEQIRPDDPLARERIASIADALVIPDEHAKEKHWDDGARTIICGLIAHVISQDKETKNLYDIRDLISQMPEDQDKLWAEMAFSEGGGGYAKDAAMRYIRGAHTNEILGILSNADKHTEWLSSPVMRHITSDPTFTISALKKRPTTIYLVIPPRQLERQNRLLRLFINLVIDAMEDGGRSKIPVLMIMDEFLALGKMPEIANAFATMASYNLILWPFVQELEKLQSLYGGSFNAFIANARGLQVFSVSDQKTKDYVSKRLGNRPLSGLGNIAKSNDNLPLRAPGDVEIDLAASERRQYIIEAGRPAMLIEKTPYYDSRPVRWLNRKGRFEGKYDPDPDFAEDEREHKKQTLDFEEGWLLAKLMQSRLLRKAVILTKAWWRKLARRQG